METDHPEMAGQLSRMVEPLPRPEEIRGSHSDPEVELFYRLYQQTPVTTKFLCVVIKVLPNDNFIITAYYTDSVKKGELLWEKK